jgi:1-acyl-sn-glycerol-3-phosphate acyltransferase
MIFKKLKTKLIESGLSEDEKNRASQALQHLNSVGFDPWGVDPDTLKASLASTIWLYKNYFRVVTHGLHNLPQGRLLIIANHSGQIPIDGMLIGTSLILEGNPPRLARAMVEKWAPGLPFVSTFFSRLGQVTGDHHNCRELLENDECVMVFPEGVAGSGKTIFKRYELQKFGTGFIRLALETKTPILPVAVIGCEESLPSISDLNPFAKKMGIPYLPIIPTGLIPLPTKVTLRYADPITFDADPDCSDAEVEKMVEQVKNAIRLEIEIGLKARGEKIFTGAAL